jgi:hypothetical protein
MTVAGLQAVSWVHSAPGSVWLDGTGIVWVRRFFFVNSLIFISFLLGKKTR